jgi:hypothetical protein
MAFYFIQLQNTHSRGTQLSPPSRDIPRDIFCDDNQSLPADSFSYSFLCTIVLYCSLPAAHQCTVRVDGKGNGFHCSCQLTTLTKLHRPNIFVDPLLPGSVVEGSFDVT